MQANERSSLQSTLKGTLASLFIYKHVPLKGFVGKKAAAYIVPSGFACNVYVNLNVKV